MDPQRESQLGKKNGLFLIIDPQTLESEERQNSDEVLSGDDGYATIFLDTLAPFSDNQGGNYALTDLKWMSGTESFLELSNKEKECQIETYEECQRGKVIEKCGCVPWQLMFNKSRKYQVRQLCVENTGQARVGLLSFPSRQHFVLRGASTPAQ